MKQQQQQQQRLVSESSSSSSSSSSSESSESSSSEEQRKKHNRAVSRKNCNPKSAAEQAVDKILIQLRKQRQQQVRPVVESQDQYLQVLNALSIIKGYNNTAVKVKTIVFYKQILFK